MTCPASNSRRSLLKHNSFSIARSIFAKSGRRRINSTSESRLMSLLLQPSALADQIVQHAGVAPELCETTLFHHPPALQDQHLIEQLAQFQPLQYPHHAAALALIEYARDHALLRRRVHRRFSLIQNQDGGPFQQCPGGRT